MFTLNFYFELRFSFYYENKISNNFKILKKTHEFFLIGQIKKIIVNLEFLIGIKLKTKTTKTKLNLKVFTASF